MKWLNHETDRPIGWLGISSGTRDSIVTFGPDNYEWDKNLIIEITHKENHPF